MGFSSRPHDGQRLYLTRPIYSVIQRTRHCCVSCAPGGLHPGHSPLGAHYP
nr:MAG TPA: hypothetical protein [Caudoviricetes sp.]